MGPQDEQSRAITQEQFSSLRRTVEKIENKVDGIDTLLRGNGKVGLVSRVAILEALNPFISEKTREDIQEAEEYAKRLADNVSKGSISWEVAAMFAANIILLLISILLNSQ